ncbi:MAG TPA: sporulation protein YhbH [Maribacter sp.]|nr:sporulation protein YhbH [Maribacter sp.]
MSIFKSNPRRADRSASDRSRHKKKIEHAIREGIHHIVSDESIIGQDGKKKIRIPVRGIKEYRFVYGDNSQNKKVGSAPGKDIKRGQKIGQSDKPEKGSGNKAGEEEGEEYYDVEITLEELSEYLFDSLKLPDIEKKKFKTIVGEKYKRSGYRSKGIRPRLSKKKTLVNKIKRRKKATLLNKDSEDERFPFHEDDLKYHHIKTKPKEITNAVIFFMMDVSGSMNQTKKFMARSFFFLLYHFIRAKYNNVEIVFISHTTVAKEVSEDEFFTRGTSGGTKISSALDLCLEITNKRFHPSAWNIYTFHCSDGDNWPDDNEKCVTLSRKIKAMSQLYCFVEITPERYENDGNTTFGFSHQSKISGAYALLKDSKFKIVNLFHSDDIWKEFKRIFGGSIV